MPELANQARKLINAVNAATTASWKEPSPYLTMLARIIVSEAKKHRPDDATIQSIDLEGNIPT